MRKKLLLLTLSLAAAAAALTTPRLQAGPLIGGGPYHACPVCTTFEDGSQCCITCQCSADGNVYLCPAIGCGQV
jgi:hypothetical protein